jgi:EAL domain-containing protein (putative c-di-GMP-specific phosphodiesterase class I)
MYQAKKAGKARHEIFDERMHSAAKEILRLETDLRRAVERDEINVHYQPIYDLETGDLMCFESLARWDHAELGPISPDKFIPLAEEIGLIDRLCEHVLRRSCHEIGALDGDAYAVSMNLSCRQFAQASLSDRIRQILDETNFAPNRLRLEITESVFFEHQDRAAEMLEQMRLTGIEINIDDFGTGYSNLSYLTRLPVSALKIDRSFVSMIDDEGRNDEIVCAIVTLARNLRLQVIAEGIETPGQLERLKELGCEAGQGFLFAKPMPFADLSAFLGASSAFGATHERFDGIPVLTSVQ